SSTTNGGASFAGGGVVENVKFDGAAGIGGKIGYTFSSPLSVYISYHYIKGDVSWDADFPQIDAASGFNGNAISHEIIGHLAYDFDISDATVFTTSAGLGLSFNELSGVVETDKGTGLFLSDVADHTQISPIAQI